jgi:O-antigen ligase
MSFSERDVIYRALFDGIIHGDVVSILIGHGVGSPFVATLEAGLAPKFAHNDWLEVGYSAGAAGLVGFATFNLAVILALRRIARRQDSRLQTGLATYAAFLIATITSSLIYSAQQGLVAFALLGFACGREAGVHVAGASVARPKRPGWRALSDPTRSGGALEPQACGRGDL